MIDPENWRGGLLKLILRVSLILGFIVYVPSVYLSVRSGLYGLVFADTFALGVIIALILFAGLPFKLRAGIFCLICYILGVVLLLSVGSISQIYLFGFSLITTLLLGLRVGILSALLNSASLLLIGYLGILPSEMAISNWDVDFPNWVVITLNFALVNTTLTLAVGAVLNAMQNALSREIATRTSLLQERTLLQTLIDTLPDIVITKDKEGLFRSGNQAALAMMGIDREDEMIGKTVFDIYPAERARMLNADDLKVFEGRRIMNREEHLVDSSGNPVWYLTIKVPLRDSAGEITGIIVISRNITDRKIAEADRDRLLARLQLQIARMPLAYLLTDADFLYTSWNPAAEQMFGFAERDVLGKHPFDLIVPGESHFLVGTIFETLKAGSMEAHGECPNLTGQGETIICEWHNTPLFDADGGFAGVLSVANDITDRKKLEEQLRQSQKMEAVGQLAGGIAHDFNNMLTVITGYSELLLGSMSSDDPKRGKLQEIRKAGERSATLTRQLLAFSRRQVLAPKVLNLNEIIRDTETMLGRLIGEDIELTTVLQADLANVKADPGQLEQVLMNLAVNARDAMPRGGKLTIETRDVDVDETYARTHISIEPGSYVMLSVSDTGTGMDVETQQRIFEPFFTTKEPGTGTGLGLAVVHGIVMQSDGNIEVYSEAGIGTSFKIYLRRFDQPEAEEKHIVSFDDAPGGTETILLVEDEGGVQRLISLTLTDLGYNVLEAVNGEKAFLVAAGYEGQIDMLLTDVVMPGIGGRAVAEHLSAADPRIKVLFMSGYTDDAVVRHGILHKEVNFLQKPFSPAALAYKVREVLEK